jgi:EpsI family protein
MRLLSSWRRFLPPALILAACAFVLQARTSQEMLPPRQKLSSFPMQIENWSGKDRAISAGDLEVLGPGEFLMRDYSSSSSEPPVNLFMAYFPSQRSGDTVHSPKNCLPGAGWATVVSGQMTIATSYGSEISINRDVVEKGTVRLLVFYWYQAHGRTTPSEYWAKVYLVEDAIRLNRTDGALVRVITPIPSAGEEAAAQTRALGFVRETLPILDSYIPR